MCKHTLNFFKLCFNIFGEKKKLGGLPPSSFGYGPEWKKQIFKLIFYSNLNINEEDLVTIIQPNKLQYARADQSCKGAISWAQTTPNPKYKSELTQTRLCFEDRHRPEKPQKI